MIKAMRDLIVGVYEHLDIKSRIDLDHRIKYTESIFERIGAEKNRTSPVGVQVDIKGVI